MQQLVYIQGREYSESYVGSHPASANISGTTALTTKAI